MHTKYDTETLILEVDPEGLHDIVCRLNERALNIAPNDGKGGIRLVERVRIVGRGDIMTEEQVAAWEQGMATLIELFAGMDVMFHDDIGCL